MPFTDNSGVRINYRVEGTGPPLVLMHGRFVSSEGHYSIGTVEALRECYWLIMIDARGHGKSGKPHEPESYRIDLLVRGVTAVLDELGISKTHYFGYSMGGRTGFDMAKYTPDVHGAQIDAMNSDIGVYGGPPVLLGVLSWRVV